MSTLEEAHEIIARWQDSNGELFADHDGGLCAAGPGEGCFPLAGGWPQVNGDDVLKTSQYTVAGAEFCHIVAKTLHVVGEGA